LIGLGVAVDDCDGQGYSLLQAECGNPPMAALRHLSAGQFTLDLRDARF